MALQPEKVLLFFVLETSMLFLIARKRRVMTYLLCFIIVGSTLGYSLTRYSRRFFSYQFVMELIRGKDTAGLLNPRSDDIVKLDSRKTTGVFVSLRQAAEITVLVRFINEKARSSQNVFLYPEYGTLYFLSDTRWISRFPTVTFSWFKERWHQELMAELKSQMPDYVILQNQWEPDTERVYFAKQKNKQKYDEVLAFVALNYQPLQATEESTIYQRKDYISGVE
jgi:hypothetical protein